MSVSRSSNRGTALTGALPSAEAATYLGISPKTLSNWRAAGRGPQYSRFGKVHGRVVYRIVDLVGGGAR